MAFVDIADERYTPEAHGGVDFETAMGRIHAVLPDGTIIKNVEVFHRVYETLEMGWIYAADWRLTLTGRPDLATIVAERQQRIECKTQGRCQIK